MKCKITVTEDDGKTVLYSISKTFSLWFELSSFVASYAIALDVEEARGAINNNIDLSFTVTKTEVDGLNELLQNPPDHYNFVLDGMNNVAGMWKPIDADDQDWMALAENLKQEYAKLPSGEQDVQCFHDWVEYVGLVESFDYCKKCDTKRTTR